MSCHLCCSRFCSDGIYNSGKLNKQGLLQRPFVSESRWDFDRGVFWRFEDHGYPDHFSMQRIATCHNKFSILGAASAVWFKKRRPPSSAQYTLLQAKPAASFDADDDDEAAVPRFKGKGTAAMRDFLHEHVNGSCCSTNRNTSGCCHSALT